MTLSIVLIGLCFTFIPDTSAQEPKASERSKDQSEAISKEKETPELWRHSMQDEIKMHTLVPSGDLFVSSGKTSSLLSADNGQVRWTRDDLDDCSRHEKLPPTCRKDGKYEYVSFFGNYLRLDTRFPGGYPIKKLGGLWFAAKRSDDRLVLVDLKTGKDAFDTSAIGFKQVHDTGMLETEGILIAWEERDKRPALAAAFDLSAGKTLWTGELPLSKKIVCLPLDGGGLWLVYGESDRGKRQVFAIESTTGRTRWESVELARGDWGKDPTALAVTDSSALVYVDKSGPIKIDLRTGTVQWRTDAFGGEQPSGVIVLRHGNLLFITREKKLAALDLASGGVLWRRDGVPLVTTRHGLLVLAGGLHMLRFETGESVWPRSLSFGGTAWLLQEDTLFQVVNNKLCSLALETGVVQELGGVKFEGGESPSDIDLFDDALLVVSSQNIAAFERDGRGRYQRYYQAPGLSGMEKVLMTAGTVAGNFVRQQMAASRAQAIARDVAFLRGGTGTGTAFYHIYRPNLGVRFHPTTNAERFIYMYNEQPDDWGRKGFSLVQIDKRSGKETGRVWSKERRPSLSVDPFAARVFLKTGDFEITAYGFAFVK